MPVLHIDQDQPGRLRIESRSLEDSALRDAGCHWRGRGHDYFHVPQDLAPVYRLRGIFGPALQFSQGVLDWLTAINAEWIVSANSLRTPGVCLDEVVSSSRLDTIRTAYEALKPAWETLGFKLRPFQEIGAAMLLNSRALVLGDDPGLGKSVMGAAAALLGQAAFRDTLPALVIAPRSTLENAWLRAFQMVAPDLKVMVFHGPLPKRRKLWQRFIDEKFDVLITTYGMVKAHSRYVSYGGTALKRCEGCGGQSAKAVAPEKCEVCPKEFNDVPWRTVIVDEAHHIFNQTSAQTRAILGVADTAGAQYRWAMTGTPMEGSPMDWWSLLRFVSPAEWPSSSVFKGRYVLSSTNWAGYETIEGLNPNTTEELRFATNHRTLRRLKPEVAADLPPQIDVERLVELSPKERKAYDTFTKELIVALEGGDLWAQNPMTVYSRQLQLASSLGTVNPTFVLKGDDLEMDFGYEPTEPSSLLDEVEDARTGEFAGQRIVMSFVHAKLLRLYVERLKAKDVKFSVIEGQTPGHERTQAIADFNAGLTDYMLLTSAGGEGISLQGCSTHFMVQPEASRIKHQQMRDRLHGIGRGDENADHILYVYFVPENTVVSRVIERFREKTSMADDVFGDSKRYLEFLQNLERTA